MINCKVCGKEIPDNEMGTCDECHEKIMARIEAKNAEKTNEETHESVKLKEDTKETKKETSSKESIKPIFTSRVLFISLLDKIFLITFILVFFIRTLAIFDGNMSSLHYDFFSRLGISFVNVIVMGIVGLVLYLIYLCAAKTMLCITEKQVYREIYFPFFEQCTSIPLEKITKVETFNILFIFRSIIIYQYNKFPLIFFTWTNEEFKSNLNKKLKMDYKEIENKVQFKELFSKNNTKKFIIFAIIYVVLIAIFGLTSLVGYLTCEDRQILGKFIAEDTYIEIEENGTCVLYNIGKDNGYDYTWRYNSNSDELTITYKTLVKYTYINDSYEDTNYLTLKFNPQTKTLTKDDIVLVKSK